MLICSTFNWQKSLQRSDQTPEHRVNWEWVIWSGRSIYNISALFINSSTAIQTHTDPIHHLRMMMIIIYDLWFVLLMLSVIWKQSERNQPSQRLAVRVNTAPQIRQHTYNARLEWKRYILIPEICRLSDVCCFNRRDSKGVDQETPKQWTLFLYDVFRAVTSWTRPLSCNPRLRHLFWRVF